MSSALAGFFQPSGRGQGLEHIDFLQVLLKGSRKLGGCGGIEHLRLHLVPVPLILLLGTTVESPALSSPTSYRDLWPWVGPLLASQRGDALNPFSILVVFQWALSNSSTSLNPMTCLFPFITKLHSYQIPLQSARHPALHPPPMNCHRSIWLGVEESLKITGS